MLLYKPYYWLVFFKITDLTPGFIIFLVQVPKSQNLIWASLCFPWWLRVATTLILHKFWSSLVSPCVDLCKPREMTPSRYQLPTIIYDYVIEWKPDTDDKWSSLTSLNNSDSDKDVTWQLRGCNQRCWIRRIRKWIKETQVLILDFALSHNAQPIGG